MKRQWLLQLADCRDCRLEWEGEGEEREGGGRGDKWGELKTRREGWNVEGGVECVRVI